MLFVWDFWIPLQAFFKQHVYYVDDIYNIYLKQFKQFLFLPQLHHYFERYICGDHQQNNFHYTINTSPTWNVLHLDNCFGMLSQNKWPKQTPPKFSVLIYVVLNFCLISNSHFRRCFYLNLQNRCLIITCPFSRVHCYLPIAYLEIQRFSQENFPSKLTSVYSIFKMTPTASDFGRTWLQSGVLVLT